MTLDGFGQNFVRKKFNFWDFLFCKDKKDQFICGGCDIFDEVNCKKQVMDLTSFHQEKASITNLLNSIFRFDTMYQTALIPLF